ncbi:hypothetical protein TNCV_2643601 [Trichonephila clavipes]|nr:hypothetical protein TNCV_2643601 [Trichonephila clavipes]
MPSTSHCSQMGHPYSRQHSRIAWFADASSLAYAAAIYCRQKHNGKIKVQLLVSKTKVAPVKQVSIPRLSCAVHIVLSSYLNRSYGH